MIQHLLASPGLVRRVDTREIYQCQRAYVRVLDSQPENTFAEVLVCCRNSHELLSFLNDAGEVARADPCPPEALRGYGLVRKSDTDVHARLSPS